MPHTLTHNTGFHMENFFSNRGFIALNVAWMTSWILKYQAEITTLGIIVSILYTVGLMLIRRKEAFKAFRDFFKEIKHFTKTLFKK